MEKTYKIYYNSSSLTFDQRWRIVDVESGKSYFAENVFINVPVETKNVLHDTSGEYNVYNYNLICKGELTFVTNDAFVNSIKEENPVKRHLLKTVTYRIVATTTTVLGAFYMGVGIEVSALLGAGEIFVKPILYFFHERTWYNSRKWKK